MHRIIVLLMLGIFLFGPVAAQSGNQEIKETRVDDVVKHVRVGDYEVTVPVRWKVALYEGFETQLYAYDSTMTDMMEVVNQYASYLMVRFVDIDMEDMNVEKLISKESDISGHTLQIFKYDVNIDGSVFQMELWINKKTDAALLPLAETILKSFGEAQIFD